MAKLGKSVTALLLHLRSPDSGTLGQGVRYSIGGGLVVLVYLSTTTVLADFVAIPFQLAVAIGFATGTAVHFTLQRLFVWVHDTQFALSLRDQFGRYLLVATSQYLITAASTSLLPSALGVPLTAIYFATALTLAGANFLVFGRKVFHGG